MKEVKLSYRDPLSGTMVWYSHNGSIDVSNGSIQCTSIVASNSVGAVVVVVVVVVVVFGGGGGFQLSLHVQIQKFCQRGTNFDNVFFSFFLSL